MSISKRKLIVYREELKDLFGLPEEIEILSVEETKDGFEFLLASRDDVSVGDLKVTFKQDNQNYDYRRTTLRNINQARKKALPSGLYDDNNFKSLTMLHSKETILTKEQADELMKGIDVSNLKLSNAIKFKIPDGNTYCDSDVYKRLINMPTMLHKSLVDE